MRTVLKDKREYETGRRVFAAASAVLLSSSTNELDFL